MSDALYAFDHAFSPSTAPPFSHSTHPSLSPSTPRRSAPGLLRRSATQPIAGSRLRCRRSRCEVAVFRELLTRHTRPLVAALLAVAALMALAGAVPR
ncbi:hypothetical protein ACIQVC_01315 [Streptomyces sp. NPDC101112]|uniref:hypothetical protein n=1 Tax=Streptomyces sp. NPDC101112 TaxID=3366105 RepID=UPI0037F5E719